MMTSVVLITGSSGGVGGALVNRYLKAGVFVIGIDKLPASKLVDNYVCINTDLFVFCKDSVYRRMKTLEIVDILPDTISEFVLINNAAWQVVKPLEDIGWEDWENSLAVNTVAPFFMAQSFSKQLALAQGHIINVTSVHSKLTKPSFTCYAASKASLESVTRSLALELSRVGVSVNAVAPGAISTSMLKAGFEGSPEKLQQLESYHPSKSIGTPEQLAAFIYCISNQQGGFLTGAVLEFNGGISGRLYDPG